MCLYTRFISHHFKIHYSDRKSAPDPPREDRESHPKQSSSSKKKSYHSSKATKQSYLDYLGLPRGLLTSFSRDLHKCDLRVWLIDNSTAMLERDSHRVSGSLDDIKKIDGVTRWEELSSTIAFHVDMATRCWIPTRSFVSLAMFPFILVEICLISLTLIMSNLGYQIMEKNKIAAIISWLIIKNLQRLPKSSHYAVRLQMIFSPKSSNTRDL